MIRLDCGQSSRTSPTFDVVKPRLKSRGTPASGTADAKRASGQNAGTHVNDHRIFRDDQIGYRKRVPGRGMNRIGRPRSTGKLRCINAEEIILDQITVKFRNRFNGAFLG